MLRSIVKNVLVDFVGDGEDVVFDTQVANQFQFFSAESLAGRVVWRVNDDGLGVRLMGLIWAGLVLESFAPFLFVERPLAPCRLWWTQADKARLGSAQNRVRAVVLVEGLEDHHF